MRYPSLTNQLLALSAKERKNIECLLRSPEHSQNLDALWEQFYDLADKNFVREFARKPSDRAWEMQLASALRCAGFRLEAPKPGPDFLTHDGENRVRIEAVVAEVGEGANRVPRAPFATVVNAPEDKIVLRITSVLARKVEWLERYIAKRIVEDSDRYVIALCANIPDYPINSWHIFRAVYGIGGWEIDRDADTNEVSGGGLLSKREVGLATVSVGASHGGSGKYRLFSASLFFNWVNYVDRNLQEFDFSYISSLDVPV